MSLAVSAMQYQSEPSFSLHTEAHTHRTHPHSLGRVSAVNLPNHSPPDILPAWLKP